MNHSYPQSFVHHTVEEMKIVKLLVMRSGTYNQMFYRPYQTSYNADIADNLARRIHNNGVGFSTNTAMLAGMAGQFMMPKQQPEAEVPITGGWSQPRGRFNMVLWLRHSSGTEMYYHFQGFTSHYDMSLQGTPDPNIEFYINSYVRLSRTYIQTATGIEAHDIVTESAQVINGRWIKNQTGTDIYGMRPSELYSVMQASQISADIWQSQLQDNIRDTRHMLSFHNVPSERSNNMPANLISKMVQSYQTGRALDEFGQDRSDIYTRSKGYVDEGNLMENAFFKQLANITGIPETTSFKMSALISIDPNVVRQDITTFMTLSPSALAKINLTGQAEYWHNPNDRLAWASTVLCNSVPTIMMEMMVTKLQFTATNRAAMGENIVFITGARDLMGNDNTMKLEVFKQRFIHEVMKDLTYQNMLTYSLEMTIDLYGDTVIDISIDTPTMVRYVMPSFCDSLISPIVTTNQHLLADNVHDFVHILKNVSGSTQSTPINETV